MRNFKPFGPSIGKSKISRKFTNNHGLKDLAKDLINVKLDKEMQTSDWGKEDYSEEQIRYAANDVLHLHDIKLELEKILEMFIENGYDSGMPKRREKY